MNPNIMVVTNCVIFIVVHLYFNVRLRRKGIDATGTPPITKRLFVFGKAAMAVCWLLFVLHAFGVTFLSLTSPPLLRWFAIGMVSGANILVGYTLYTLDEASIVGLPTGQTSLKHHGIYRISRNPMYVGFSLISFSACVYTLNLLVAVLAVISVMVHHHIILAEEVFLSRRFGDEWTAYSMSVRRYV
jgi:protein-S-isoprenylcysteine O-methyltransferase Ste14